LCPETLLQLQGIESVQEGDYTSPFALAKILLEVGWWQCCVVSRLQQPQDEL
jgi:hypothetical protein